MAKYTFNDDGYMILISNLKDIYGEKLSAVEVKKRFIVSIRSFFFLLKV